MERAVSFEDAPGFLEIDKIAYHLFDLSCIQNLRYGIAGYHTLKISNRKWISLEVMLK
jgi:hypothetical protein